MWGGDWNLPLRGPLTGFTVRGRDRLVRAVDELRLTVHTEAELAQPTRYGRSHAIDHFASRHAKRPVEVMPGAPSTRSRCVRAAPSGSASAQPSGHARCAVYP